MTKINKEAGRPAPPGPDEMTALLASPITVGNYQVKAWTLKQFDAIYPLVKPIARKLVAAGLTIDNLEAFAAGGLVELLPELMPDIRPVIAATLEVPLAEVEALDWGQGSALAIAIIVQNLEPLKNCVALIPQLTGRIRAFTPSP
jgi:hypothetical protein